MCFLSWMIFPKSLARSEDIGEEWHLEAVRRKSNYNCQLKTIVDKWRWLFFPDKLFQGIEAIISKISGWTGFSHGRIAIWINQWLSRELQPAGPVTENDVTHGYNSG